MKLSYCKSPVTLFYLLAWLQGCSIPVQPDEAPLEDRAMNYSECKYSDFFYQKSNFEKLKKNPKERIYLSKNGAPCTAYPAYVKAIEKEVMASEKENTNVENTYIGKTLWVKKDIDALDNNFLHSRVYRFTKVKILEIVDKSTIGETSNSIPRYFKMNAEGKIFYASTELLADQSYLVSNNPLDGVREVVASLIKDGKYAIGMTSQEVLLSIGEPARVNRTVTNSTVHEQWVYGNGKYLYFENGILGSWQE